MTEQKLIDYIQYVYNIKYYYCNFVRKRQLMMIVIMNLKRALKNDLYTKSIVVSFAVTNNRKYLNIQHRAKGL